MAKALWGNVFLFDEFAGVLRQEPGERVSFTYDLDYIHRTSAAISHCLPVQEMPHICENGLHPFFDNLVAEGWLEQAQTRLLGKRQATRFELLLAFGYDCIGAVSIIDPDPGQLSQRLINTDDPKEVALIKNRASLSGVQPKFALIKEGDAYRATHVTEMSTHIAKFPSMQHEDLVFNEYLTMMAFKKLLPDDRVADVMIQKMKGQSDLALIVQRFDREAGARIHFEEFNQLLEQKSARKYEGSHQDMSRFILHTEHCLSVENYKLFRRILAGILMGNTDMHLKNFAMLHTKDGLRLSPSYDQVGAALYDYKTMALTFAGVDDLQIGKIKTRHVIALAREFELSNAVIEMCVQQLDKHRDAAKSFIVNANIGSLELRENLIKYMDKRWNGTFALIGDQLLKKL